MLLKLTEVIFLLFYRVMHMHSVDHAMARCLSVTCWYSVKTTKCIINAFFTIG